MRSSLVALGVPILANKARSSAVIGGYPWSFVIVPSCSLAKRAGWRGRSFLLADTVGLGVRDRILSKSVHAAGGSFEQTPQRDLRDRDRLPGGVSPVGLTGGAPRSEPLL